MPEKTRDQQTGDFKVFLRSATSPSEAFKHGLVIDVSAGMGLGIEEKFGMDDPISMCPHEIIVCQLLEVRSVY